MRILAIRGKNLASLRGEFAIELNQPPLEQAGLFAITGHTGAGKSTLLDALCLALFDKIPRLLNVAIVKVGRFDEDEKQRISSNDVASIMSRGTASAYAEVEFYGIDRQFYQAHWEVKRARNKVSGRLQKQVVTLKNLNNGEIIGQNKSDTLEEISRRIGLNFEQFRRSVLLAQGDFAAFLKAKSEERSSLLERITGTDIYSRLSMAAHQRYQQENTALQLIEEKLKLEIPMEKEQRQELDAAITELGQQQQQIKQQLQNSKNSLQWFETRSQLQQQKNDAVSECEKLELEKANSIVQKQELERVIGVQPLRELTRRLDELKDNIRRLSTQKSEAEEQNKNHKQSEAETTAIIATLQQQSGKKKTQLAELTPQLLQARELDTKIKIADAQYAEQELQTQSLKKELDQYHSRKLDIHQLENQQQAITQALEKIEDHLHYLGTEQQKIALDEVVKKQEQVDKQLQYWLEAEAVYEKFINNGEQIQSNRLEQEKSHRFIDEQTKLGLESEKQQLAVSASLDEARRALSMLQESVTDGAQSLRGLLKDNEPCPVCGSLEHPWSGEDSLLNSKYHQQKQRVETLEKDLYDCTLQRHQAQQLIEQRNTELKKINKDIESLNTEGQDLCNAWSELSQQIKLPDKIDTDQQAELLKVEIQGLNEQKMQLRELNVQAIALQKDLTAKLAEKDQWQMQEKQLQQQLSEQKLLANSITNLEQQLSLQIQELEKRADNKQALQRQRQTFFNGEAVDEVENRVQDSIKTLTDKLELETRHLDNLKQRQLVSAQQCIYLQQSLDTDHQQQKEYEQRLSAELERKQLSRVELHKLLTRDENWIEAEKKYFRALDSRLIQAETLLKERNERLQQHEQAVDPTLLALSETDIQDLKQQLQEQESTLQILVQSQQEHLLLIKQDDDRKKRMAEFQDEFSAQQSLCQQWGEINELIGSASGNKFRVFAQSLTLESLLAHANIHLKDFARRYQLQRVPGSDLELQIIDRDMADEVRSVQSLSGGESFLVSLALALALASLSSTQTQVESLFIDEGFGTLDQETLDIAIASLDTLQGLGRKVGIISHVPILVERIGTRVVVEKMGGGCSKIHIEY